MNRLLESGIDFSKKEWAIGERNQPFKKGIDYWRAESTFQERDRLDKIFLVQNGSRWSLLFSWIRENTSPDSSASHITCLVNEDTCTHDKRKQTRGMPDEQHVTGVMSLPNSWMEESQQIYVISFCSWKYKNSDGN